MRARCAVSNAAVLAVLLVPTASAAQPGFEPDFPETPATGQVDQTKLGAEAPKPVDPRAPNVDWGVGGVVQLDVIYDVDAVGLEPNSGFFREFITSEIPIAGPAAERTGRTGFSPNQSKLYGYVGVPTRWGPFKMFAQFNLARSETATEFQIHRLWGHWAWLHVAYDYTQLLNMRTIPNTLDYEGPGALPETLRGQALLRIPLAKLGTSNGWFISVGAEDSPTDATLPEDVVGSDRIPATVAKVIFANRTMDFQLGGLYRRLRFVGPDSSTSTNGWAISFQGAVDLLDSDEVSAGVVYGRALGAYLDDTAGFGLDAAPDGDDIRAIPALSAWAAYTHYWIASLSSTATFGYVTLDNEFDTTPNAVGTYHQTFFVSCNVIWTPWHAVDVGIEYMWGQRTVTQNTAVDGSTTNDNHRLQWTVLFRFDYSRRGVKRMLNPATYRP